MSDTTHRLEAQPLHGVLNMLRAECERARLGRYQRFYFRAFELLVLALPALAAGLAVSESVVAKALRIPVLLSLAAGSLLLLLNLALIWRGWRQYRLAGQLPLLILAEDLWHRATRPPRRTRWRKAALAGAPAALLILYVYSWICCPFAGPPSPALTAIVLALCCALPFLLHGLDRLLGHLRRPLAYSEDVTGLRKAIDGLLGSGQTAVDLPADMAMRLADIERLHTFRLRAEALQEAAKRASAEYGLAREPAFSAAVRELAPELRLAVLEALERIGEDPTIGTSHSDGGWRYPVAGTGCALRYAIDPVRRRVHTLSFERPTASGIE